MRDKRPVDELSIEELERILAIKKREARMQQRQRMQRDGRAVIAVPAADPAAGALASPAAVTESAAGANALSLSALSTVAEPRFDEDQAAEPLVEYVAVPKGRHRRRSLINRVLLVVEVAAVIGIALIGIELFGAIRSLERETASAQALADEQRRAGIPTLAPTPTLRLENFVLPGGHTIQDGAPVFNYSEVPAHLLPLVESQWIQPVVSRPPVTSETALRILIPRLNIEQSIVQGVDWEALKQGVGQLQNGANPGDDIGNVVLAAHNDIYGQIFRDLDQLSPGDQFQLQTRTESFTYTVTEIRIVEPDDVEVLETRGSATATLISCYPYQVNTQRIVVFADRVA